MKPRPKHKWSLFPPSQCVCNCGHAATGKTCPICYDNPNPVKQ